MLVLDGVSCGDQYTSGAGIKYVYRSNGGSFVVTGNDAYCRLWYGAHGHETPMQEFHAPVGVGVIYPETIGVEFRNYTAGSTAIVSATLSQTDEPTITLGAGGVAGASSVTSITGVVSGAGSIVAGTGFTVAHPAAGNNQITFTQAFAAAPLVVISGNDGPLAYAVTSILPTGFLVLSWNLAGVTTNGGVSFLAQDVV